MPISFEEVTAEVPAERPAAPAAATANDSAGGDADAAATQRLLQALALQQERAWRLHVD